MQIPKAPARAFRQQVLRAPAPSTRELDLRVLVQQDAFTIHADNSDLAEVEYKARPWRIAFRVPSGEKEKLRETLQSLGFTLAKV
jgi:hypothetical protein